MLKVLRVEEDTNLGKTLTLWFKLNIKVPRLIQGWLYNVFDKTDVWENCNFAFLCSIILGAEIEFLWLFFNVNQI